MSCDADIESTRSLTSHNSSQNNLTEIPRSRNMQRCLSCLFILSIGILLILVVFLIVITMEEDGSKRQISVNDVTILDDKTVILDSLTAQKVTKIMNSKIQDQTEKFHQRFPRDHRYVSKKSLDILPKKSHSMTTAGRRVDQTQLSNLEDQVMEIFESVDENEDKATDAWEMHDWIVYVEGLVHKSILDDQWHNYGLDDKANITWADFASQFFPHGIQTSEEKMKIKRKRRRWLYADSDLDDILDKNEFNEYLFPNNSLIWVPEALEELDTDFDGLVSRKEFSNMPGSEFMTSYFNTLDHDQDGFLDLEEIAQWISPKGFIQAYSEVVYLIEKLDSDQSKDLDLSEIINQTDIFYNSQMTYFGKIFSVKNLKQTIFHIPDVQSSTKK